MNSAKEILINCNSFEELQAKVAANTITVQEECNKHGLTNHSRCTLSDSSICLECLMERRFKCQ